MSSYNYTVTLLMGVMFHFISNISKIFLLCTPGIGSRDLARCPARRGSLDPSRPLVL